jgi:hypothetical protein
MQNTWFFFDYWKNSSLSCLIPAGQPPRVDHDSPSPSLLVDVWWRRQLYASTLCINIKHQLTASTLRINEICAFYKSETHQLYASTLRINSTHQLYASTLCINSAHQLYASTLRINSMHQLYASSQLFASSPTLEIKCTNQLRCPIWCN